MESARRVTFSAAGFVLVCFFLPWVQVSCGGVKDTASGFDLARGGSRALWLIPLLMLTVVLVGLARVRKNSAATFALVSVVGGLISAYLMNQKRMDAENASELVRVTGWLWLGLFSSLAVVVSALFFYLRRDRSP
jgi:purine-cytosine permease-like protein